MPDEVDELLSSLETYWAIACRRRWWILFPTFLTWAALWGISWLLPATYQSEAVILLKQQIVPNQYVVPNVSASPQDRLQTITQQVLSRTRLQAIIDQFHLYPEPHGLGLLLMPGDPIDHMRRDIEIELVPVAGHPDEFTAFKLRYTAHSPELAQQVNQVLTSPFVTENVEAQQQLSEETTKFLESQLSDARAKMEEQEVKVAAFKANHIGELSGQSGTNGQQILAGIQIQLQNLHQALDSARQRRLYLESLLQQYESARPSPGGRGSGNGTAGNIEDIAAAPAKEIEKELADLRLRLQDLQERYTDDYPDVVALKDKIEKKEKQKKLAENEAAVNLRSRKTANAAEPAAPEKAQNESSTASTQLEIQLKANQQEIQNYQLREKDLESQVSSYMARLKTAPETEQELADISRGYEESKANYNSLLQKQMQSQLATSLEQRQKGEQFRIVDQPSLPNKHIAPNRFRFSLQGVALGIAFGFGIVALLELTDIRVRQEKDLRALVPVPVLVSIPRVRTPSEKTAHAIAQWLDFRGDHRGRFACDRQYLCVL